MADGFVTSETLKTVAGCTQEPAALAKELACLKAEEQVFFCSIKADVATLVQAMEKRDPPGPGVQDILGRIESLVARMYATDRAGFQEFWPDRSGILGASVTKADPGPRKLSSTVSGAWVSGKVLREVLYLIFRPRKSDAIQVIRARTGLELPEAEALVERFIEEMRRS